MARWGGHITIELIKSFKLSYLLSLTQTYYKIYAISNAISIHLYYRIYTTARAPRSAGHVERQHRRTSLIGSRVSVVGFHASVTGTEDRTEG